ncbi:hypothetical protein V4U86_27515 [Mycobacterium sp. AMU20-3851]|jgi:hypothetical protein|uniref:hypothetical protein n=1 Tax=Mycobacterium sp. AMU20-3851 TaxID=3122055 RepID=UPI003754A6FD
MGQPYPDDVPEEYDEHWDYGEYEDPDDEIVPRPSNRGAVGIFLLGWLFLPSAAVVLSRLQSPWFEVASVVTLTFIAIFVVAVVRVVRNFWSTR